MAISELLIPPEGILPAGFSYPEEYFEYLLFDEKEFEENGVLSTLSFTWPAHLSSYYEVFKNVTVVDAPRFPSRNNSTYTNIFGKKLPLVHMAQDNGDRHYFFIADGSRKIAVLDMGGNPKITYQLDDEDFLTFINEIRKMYDHKPWIPISK